MTQQQSTSHSQTASNKLYALPLRPPSLLVGRNGDLEVLRNPLRERRAILLHGPLGIGKTALAAQLASQFTSESRDVLWIESMDDSLDALLLRTAREYELDEAAAGTSRADRIAAVTEALESQNPFVVIDGIVNLAAVREFIVNCAYDLPVVVTANQPSAGPWSLHAVNRLDYADAEVLLKHVAGESLNANPGEMTALNGHLAGHPLSIVITGRQMAVTGTSPAELIRRIPDMPTGETNHTIGLLMANYRLLPPEMQGVLLLTGTTFAGSATTELLHRAAGLPAESISRHLKNLIERGFVFSRSQYEHTTYSTHDIVRAFSAAFLRGKDQLDAIRDRQMEALFQYLEKRVIGSDPDLQDEIAAESNNILEAARSAAQNGQTEHLQRLVALVESEGARQFAVTRDFEPEIDWIRRIAHAPEVANQAMLEVAEDLPEEPVDSDPLGKAPAESASWLDDIPQQDIFAAATLPSRDARFLDSTTIDAPVTETGEALPPIEESAELTSVELSTEETPEANTLDDIEADDSGEHVILEALNENGDTEPVPETLATIPVAPPSAPLPEMIPDADGLPPTITPDEQAASLTFQADGSIEDELAALEMLAQQNLENENYDEVLSYVDQGLKIAHDGNNPQREARMLTILGDLQVTLNRDDGAETAYKEAIEALHTSGSPLEIALVLEKLGYLYVDQDRHAEAIDVWQQSLALFEQENQPDYIRDALHNLSDTYAELFRWEPAIQHQNKALAQAQKLNNETAVYDDLLRLGELYEASGNPQAALPSYQRTLAIAFRSGNGTQIGENLWALARLWIDDTVQLNRVVQLLEAASVRLPENPDIQRLLNRAHKRQERLTATNVTLLPAYPRLEDYADFDK